MDEQTRDGDHPADVANVALMRVSGILASLSALFDDRRSQYAVDVPFVAHSVKALVQLVDEASHALVDLHNSCDLTIIDRTADAYAAVVPEVDADDHDVQVNFSSLRKRTEEFEVALGHGQTTNDAPATSYEELLQKVTAAEVFANAQASQIEGGETSMLLPILHSLKQDIMRMKRVA